MSRTKRRLALIGERLQVPMLVFTAALFLAGCNALDELLTVDAPSRVVASDLDDPAAADLLVASVANEFRCMWTHYASASAMTGNEMGEATNTTTLTIWDTRIHDTSGYGSQYASADCGSGQPALYLPLSRTRWLADQVLTSLNGWADADVPSRSEKIGEMALYAGYSYLLFAEAFCTDEMAFDGGARQSRAAVWNLAVDRFDQAISSGSSDVANAARVGKGRALLNLGEYSNAASAVASVPAGFSWTLQYSNAEAVTRNKIWEMNHRDDEATVEPMFRNVVEPSSGQPDPRIAVTDKGITGPGADIPIWTADKYASADSEHEAASWEEAQLIIAEANANGAGGNLSDAVDIINTLHGNVSLPDLPGGMTQQEVMDQIVYERSAELFLEGQHLHDLWRFNLDLVPAPGEDHPFGALYGDEICFDLPAVEFLNNENTTG